MTELAPGSVVVVTGASAGIGRATAVAFARRGYRVALLARFSTAAPSRLSRAVTEGGYGPTHVNVASQRNDPDSLLSFMRLLIKGYRESPELGWATCTFLDQPHRGVLPHGCRWDDRWLRPTAPDNRRLS